MNKTELTCPRCESNNLECRQLGVRGSGWLVAFGTGMIFGEKDDLNAYACQECGFVFLQLKDIPKQSQEEGT